MKRVFQLLAVAALVVCMWAPIEVFVGAMSEQDYKSWFLAASVAWFLFATAAFAKGRN